eukprot:GGOE01015397.1.p1 GENE.GGOE01015397.1~~GGOE01015397.1.p1  ORF type:complete len:444 (-),score=120.20 GGOE01015397.1:145-1341(-)
MEGLWEQLARQAAENSTALCKELHTVHQATVTAVEKEEALEWQLLAAEGRAGLLALERAKVDLEGRMECARLVTQVTCLTSELERLRAERSPTGLYVSLEEVKEQLSELRQQRAATLEADTADRKQLLADSTAWQKWAEELVSQLRSAVATPCSPCLVENAKTASATCGAPANDAAMPLPISPPCLAFEERAACEMTSPVSVDSVSSGPTFDEFAIVPQARRRQSAREAERQRNNVVAHIMALRHSERERSQQLSGLEEMRRSSCDSPPYTHAPVMVYSTSSLVRSRNFLADQSTGEDISSCWPSSGPLSPVLQPEWAPLADICLALGAVVDARMVYLGFGRADGQGDSHAFINPDTRRRDFWGFLAVHLFRGMQLKLRGVDLPEWVLFCTQSRLAWD